MKLNPKQSSIPVQTFEDYGFAYFYEQKDGSILTAIPPNPPTPEAVAKAQFIDKTYQWNGSAAAKAARSEPRN